MQSFPSIRGPKVRLTGIPGTPPDLANPPHGCRFHPRCPQLMAQCRSREPAVYAVEASRARCLLYDDGA
jgi:peptide/nickel transport system ATP-binding protein